MSQRVNIEDSQTRRVAVSAVINIISLLTIIAVGLSLPRQAYASPATAELLRLKSSPEYQEFESERQALLGDLRGALESAGSLDLAQISGPEKQAMARKLAVSSELLAETLSRWNPTLSKKDVYRNLAGQMSDNYPQNCILKPALQLIDASMATGNIEYARAAQSAISLLNPQMGEVIKNRLGVEGPPLDASSPQFNGDSLERSITSFLAYAGVGPTTPPAPSDARIPDRAHAMPRSFASSIYGDGSKYYQAATSSNATGRTYRPPAFNVDRKAMISAGRGPISGESIEECTKQCTVEAEDKFMERSMGAVFSAALAAVGAKKPLTAAVIFVTGETWAAVSAINQRADCIQKNCSQPSLPPLTAPMTPPPAAQPSTMAPFNDPKRGQPGANGADSGKGENDEGNIGANTSQDQDENPNPKAQPGATDDTGGIPHNGQTGEADKSIVDRVSNWDSESMDRGLGGSSFQRNSFGTPDFSRAVPPQWGGASGPGPNVDTLPNWSGQGQSPGSGRNPFPGSRTQPDLRPMPRPCMSGNYRCNATPKWR